MVFKLVIKFANQSTIAVVLATQNCCSSSGQV